MRKKTIISVAASVLFILASVSAFAGERVYVRVYKDELQVVEKGVATKTTIADASSNFTKRGDSLKALSDVMEKYLEQGYKLLTTTSNSGLGYTEYILEKP